jgi:hypothetical protein
MSHNESYKSNHSLGEDEGQSDPTSFRTESLRYDNAVEREYQILLDQFDGVKMLEAFQITQKSILKLTEDELKDSYRKIRKSLLKSDSSMVSKIGEDLSISFIKHAHYIYSFRLSASQEDNLLLETRLRQFEEHDYPQEKIYLRTLKILKFLSNLMIKWNIFKLSEYCYRFKGRGLTVKMLNMDKINEQCLAPDIIWFSFAIENQPFDGKIDRVLNSYAKILQDEINSVFAFIRKNDLENCNFRRPFKWFIFKSKDNQIFEFFNILQSVEVAYRYFEKGLIQELLKNA